MRAEVMVAIDNFLTAVRLFDGHATGRLNTAYATLRLVGATLPILDPALGILYQPPNHGQTMCLAAYHAKRREAIERGCRPDGCMVILDAARPCITYDEGEPEGSDQWRLWFVVPLPDSVATLPFYAIRRHDYPRKLIFVDAISLQRFDSFFDYMFNSLMQCPDIAYCDRLTYSPTPFLHLAIEMAQARLPSILSAFQPVGSAGPMSLRSGIDFGGFSPFSRLVLAG